MATTHREQLAKQLLQSHDDRSRHVTKPMNGKLPHGNSGAGRPLQRRKHPHRLPSPTEEQLERRELGWDGRFACDTPPQPKRPQRNRVIDDSANAQDAKERKIRDERQHYGHSEVYKPRHRPGVGRLAPIAPLGAPPQEVEAVSSKEEKLRFSVLKAIDARETLVYQLNALILCTPVQEALVMAAARAHVDGDASQLKPRAGMTLAISDRANNNTMSNAREATRLAQQLGTDLQIAGIQVVESIVEWMLEAGAKADQPPEFLWRGRNYFLKMESDLDFAGPELFARGVELDCFSLTNPLCIRPDQRLGRVVAAQTIIGEMVEMTCQGKGSISGKSTARTKKTLAENKSPRSKSTRQTPRSSGRRPTPEANDVTTITTKQHAAGADEMIVSFDDEEEDADFTSPPSVETANNATESSLSNAQHDHESANDLISLLDESFCANVAPFPQELNGIHSSPGEKSLGNTPRSQYENSFEDEQQSETQNPADAPDSHAKVLEQDLTCKISTEPFREDVNPETDDEGAKASSRDRDVIAESTADAHATAKNDTLGDADVHWDRLAQILASGDGTLHSLSGSMLKLCANWQKEKGCNLEAAEMTGSWANVLDTLSGSLLHSVEPACRRNLSVDKVLEVISVSAESVRVGLPTMLLEDCRVVIDTICAALAHTIRQDLERISPLVSEVDYADVIERAEVLLRREDVRDTLGWVVLSANILRQLTLDQRIQTKLISEGLSQLLQVFYPYIINQRRDKLLPSWRRTSRVFVETCNIHFEGLAFLLNGTCKVLLLTVLSLARSPEQIEEDESLEIPKLTIVCDRVNVLSSSVAAVSAKCFKTVLSIQSHYQLFPFFRCSFGEKLVDGVTVEEGEGKGPLKEWFTLVAQDLIARWRKVDLPTDTAIDDYDPVLINGNKLVVDGLSNLLKAGYKVEWRSAEDDTSVSRIINRCDTQNGTYMLDRGGLSNHSFPVSELHVFQPQAAFLVYVQSSESYWLNESLADTPASREVLEFCGWLLANALTHQCGLQLRLHRLLFELILREDRVVTLEDLASLDPPLSEAMQQLQHMKPSEFAGYLEFEGLPSHWSVDEYTKHTVDSKFGSGSSIGWQLPVIRRGFYRVFTAQEMVSVCLSADDLADQLGGDTTLNSDFKIGEVFRVSVDPDFAACTPLRRCFWAAVNGFDPSLKRSFVKFVTGIDTLPQAGAEFLRIEMPFPATTPRDCEKAFSLLPQSHTCDNTLELPHYWRALCWKHEHDAEQPNESLERELLELLQRKLRQAAEYSSGYGLDGSKSLIGSLAGILPGSHAAAAAVDEQDSYESLDLPALGGESEDAARETVETTDMRLRGEATQRSREEEEYGGEDWEEEV